jgi:hypothetical protein
MPEDDGGKLVLLRQRDGCQVVWEPISKLAGLINVITGIVPSRLPQFASVDPIAVRMQSSSSLS